MHTKIKIYTVAVSVIMEHWTLNHPSSRQFDDLFEALQQCLCEGNIDNTLSYKRIYDKVVNKYHKHEFESIVLSKLYAFLNFAIVKLLIWYQ